MAQVESKSTTTGPARNGGASKTPSAASPAPAPARRSLFAGFGRRPLVDRPVANGRSPTGAQPRKRGMFQFAIGLVLFMVGSQVILYLLAALGDVFHVQGFLQSSIAPRGQGVLVLSGLTWFMLVWFMLVALLYYVLIKTKLIPQDPMGVKARARDQAGRGGTSTSRAANGAKASAAVPTVNIRPQTRADRRAAAQERAAREAAAAAKSKRKAGQTAAVKVASEPEPAASGEYDAEYERIKTAQRQQRRREAKR